MSRRKRRRSEKQAEKIRAEEQGDLLADIEAGEDPSEGDAEAVDAAEEGPVEPDAPAADPAPVAEDDTPVVVEPEEDTEGEAVPQDALAAENAAEGTDEDDVDDVDDVDDDALDGDSADEPADQPRSSVTFELVPEDAAADRTPTTHPPAGERLARAKELVQSGRVRDAVELYREVLSENPANLKARNNLGALYEALGSHDLALAQFEAAESIDPENVEVLNNLGSVLGVLARYEDAEKALRRAQRLDPENLEVRASLGIVAFRRGVYTLAEQELRSVCDRNAEHGPAFFYRGEALNRLGRYDEALEVLERAVVLQPGNAKAYYTLGILYDRKHMPEEAGLMYRKAREAQRG